MLFLGKQDYMNLLLLPIPTTATIPKDNGRSFMHSDRIGLDVLVVSRWEGALYEVRYIVIVVVQI